MNEPSTVGNATLHHGDCLDVLRTLPAESVHTCITSPPYWGLRDYGVEGQIGLEASPAEFVARLVEVFREVRRVLRDDGTLWLNLGDSYAGSPGGWQGKNGERASRTFTARIGLDKGGNGLKPKDLCGMPWRVAFALQADGWWLRQDIIWHKPNPMPESVRDRCTKAHEYLFLLSKSERYYFDNEAIKEPASLDTHERYARGKSDSHTWADGGPGGQTIARSFDHMRKPVAGWANGPGDHSAVGHAQARTDGSVEDGDKFGRGNGVGWGYATNEKPRTKGRKLAEVGSGTKNNASFDAAMVAMPDMRNKRSVWTVPTAPFSEAHFATFPPDLIRPCVLAGAPAGGLVLDPFNGAGTTGLVALQEGRGYLGIELNADYLEMTRRRLDAVARQERMFA